MDEKISTLLRGEPQDVAELLYGDDPPDTIQELRMALTNALDRIAKLERSANGMRSDDEHCIEFHSEQIRTDSD